MVDEAPSLAAGSLAVERVLRRSPRLLQGLLLVRLVLCFREDLKWGRVKVCQFVMFVLC